LIIFALLLIHFDSILLSLLSFREVGCGQCKSLFMIEDVFITLKFLTRLRIFLFNLNIILYRSILIYLLTKLRVWRLAIFFKLRLRMFLRLGLRINLRRFLRLGLKITAFIVIILLNFSFPDYNHLCKICSENNSIVMYQVTFLNCLVILDYKFSLIDVIETDFILAVLRTLCISNVIESSNKI
jgi:hypothetical protein